MRERCEPYSKDIRPGREEARGNAHTRNTRRHHDRNAQWHSSFMQAEEKCLDVLQKIEPTIIRVRRHQPSLLDKEVREAISGRRISSPVSKRPEAQSGSGM